MLTPMLDWRLTAKCDERCSYCFSNCANKDLDQEQFTTVLSKIAQSSFSYVCITGGEPFLVPDRTLEAINFLKKHGKKTYLSTNAKYLGDNYSFVINNIDILGLPLDGYDEQSASLLMRSVQCFTSVVDILTRFKGMKRSFF